MEGKKEKRFGAVTGSRNGKPWNKDGAARVLEAEPLF